MYSYTIEQWLLFFYCYCFLGWCIESSIVSFSQKRWVNRGFVHGPMLPIYGSGAIMVLVCTLPVKNHIALVYVFGMLGATVLEYITGVLMEKLLKVRYWDYSKQFMNLNGHICLKSSLFWGVLSVFMTYVVHEPIETLILSIPRTIAFGITSLITVVFGVDLYYSAKAAINFAMWLQKVQAIRNELELLAEQFKEEKVENFKERSSEMKAELTVRIKHLQLEKNELLKKIGVERNRLVSHYPSAVSTSFKGVLEEVKSTIEDKLRERTYKKEKEHEKS